MMYLNSLVSSDCQSVYSGTVTHWLRVFHSLSYSISLGSGSFQLESNSNFKKKI